MDNTEKARNGDGNERIRETFERAKQTELESPRPLRRAAPTVDPYPYYELGPDLAPVVEAVQAATQAPIATAAQVTIGTVNLIIQQHVNIELPTGEVKPVSEFFITVADSGERKTSCESRTNQGVLEYEQELAEKFRDEWQHYQNELEAFEKQRKEVLADHKGSSFEEKRDALDELGPEPMSPPRPTIVCQEPTPEGLLRLLREGHGYGGIFSSEGGMFVGGHGMGDEAKMRTITTLSCLFDGTPISRPRAGEASYTLLGRRLAMNLLVQPVVADRFFNDQLVREQGLLSRFLPCAPRPTAGTRFYRDPTPWQISTISRFSCRVIEILKTPPPCNEKDSRELRPRALKLSPDARLVFIEYHDWLEKLLAPEGELAPIKEFANKSPEHAARLAGTMETFADLKAEYVSCENMLRCTTLARHYLTEWARINALIQDSPDLALAEKTLEWLLRWLHDHPEKEDNKKFPLLLIYQYGPYALRHAEKARAIVKILADHSWVYPIEGGVIFEGKLRREAFVLHPEARKK